MYPYDNLLMNILKKRAKTTKPSLKINFMCWVTKTLVTNKIIPDPEKNVKIHKINDDLINLSLENKNRKM